jgi:dephospho-CoA kinase
VVTILITGMSGAGKSTLLDGLSSRGHAVVDTDYGEWVLDDGRWNASRISSLLDQEHQVVVAGAVENQVEFYDRFDHVVLLWAPLEVLIQRVSTRTSNPYGRTADEQAEIAHYVSTVEPLLRASCTLELDGRGAPAMLVDTIEALLLNAR